MSQFSDDALKLLAMTCLHGRRTQALAAELITMRAENAQLKAELANANKLEEGLLVTGEKLAAQAE